MAKQSVLILLKNLYSCTSEYNNRRPTQIKKYSELLIPFSSFTVNSRVAMSFYHIQDLSLIAHVDPSLL